MARLATLAVVVFAALGLAQSAFAAGGDYSFDGGTRAEQTTVTAALNVSKFDWNVVPHVTVHIARGIPTSEAARGEIWLDADLLDAGKFSWGVVQHEYAHEVDFLLLDDSTRALLAPQLGGVAWWQSAGATHDQLSSERFASTLAWAYWTSPANSMKPVGPGDESAAMPPAAFRAALAQVLPAAVPVVRH